MNLSKQCEKVYDYIRSHPGCTNLDIINGTGLAYPSARIAALRKAGVPVIVIGKKKAPGKRSGRHRRTRCTSLVCYPRSTPPTTRNPYRKMSARTTS
jgi:hypothetical protein